MIAEAREFLESSADDASQLSEERRRRWRRVAWPLLPSRRAAKRGAAIAAWRSWLLAGWITVIALAYAESLWRQWSHS